MEVPGWLDNLFLAKMPLPCSRVVMYEVIVKDLMRGHSIWLCAKLLSDKRETVLSPSMNFERDTVLSALGLIESWLFSSTELIVYAMLASICDSGVNVVYLAVYLHTFGPFRSIF